MLNSMQRQQVLSVLEKNIEVTTSTDEIFVSHNKIYSSQTYNSGLDQDMCDFAVGFYEILYSRPVLVAHARGKSQFCNLNFAGDTMNTGIYSNKSRFKTKLPAENRHCLANFWLIPYEDGRKRQKPQRDYVDSYLNFVKDGIEAEKAKFETYQSFDEFLQIQFIPSETATHSQQEQISFISRRARLIAQSDKANELWQYFTRFIHKDNSLF